MKLNIKLQHKIIMLYTIYITVIVLYSYDKDNNLNFFDMIYHNISHLLYWDIFQYLKNSIQFNPKDQH